MEIQIPRQIFRFRFHRQYSGVCRDEGYKRTRYSLSVSYLSLQCKDTYGN